VRKRGRDEDEARRRFDAVWPGASGRPESTVEEWRRFDEKPDAAPRPAGEPGDESGDSGFDPDDSGLVSGGSPAGSDAGPGGSGRRVDRDSARAVLGAFDPGRRGLRGLVAVGVVVALVAAYLAWRAQPHAEPVPAPPSATRAPATGLPSPAASVIVVAVQGRVAHPGLVRLPAGSRVADAIAAAGGALPGVDLSLVNLARKLSDGELVVVGLPQAGAAGAGSAPGSGGGDPATGAKVNLNTASLTDLESLPGIGPALAQHIVDYRTQHGDFHTVEDLRQVTGIGDAKFAAVKDLVTV
jgi:competence protein ComEA